MKKKGLIISTIVMVVVLIASLTTATYAWFSQSANAQIEQIQVVTQASEGLQIAVYNPANGDFSSGSLTAEGAVWTGATGGWGDSLSFDMSSQKFYAVSGDGQSMYSPVTPNTAVSENVIKSASVMKTATPNGEYFTANVALTNTKQDADEVVISSLSITPTVGGAAATSGIVDSMRIAVFVRNEVNEDANTYDNTPTLKFVLNPYSNVSYAKASRQFSIANEASQTQYITYASFESGVTTYGTPTKAAFAAEKYIAGAKASTSGNPATLNATTGPANEITFTKADQTTLFNFGSVAKNGVLYLQIVIWFEGEDVDCINAFAGGGATVGMNFGFVND